MKPAWLVAGRSITNLEYRWRQRHEVWGDWDDFQRPRHPAFRNKWMKRGEWYPAPREKRKVRSKRFREAMSHHDLEPF